MKLYWNWGIILIFLSFASLIKAQDWKESELYTSLEKAFEQKDIVYRLQVQISEFKERSDELALLNRIHELRELRELRLNEGRYAPAAANLDFDNIFI